MDIELDEFFRTDTIYIDGRMGYFITHYLGEGERLFSVDFQTNELRFLGRLPEDSSVHRAHPYCVKCNDIIYCLPANGRDILYFDLAKKTWNIISNDQSVLNRPAITYAWNADQFIYAFISEKGMMLKLDLTEHTQEILYPPENSIPCGYDVTVDPDNPHLCYTALSKEPKVFQWNMEKMKCETYVVPEMEEGIGTIALQDSIVWMTGYASGDVYQWKIGSTNVVRIKQDIAINHRADAPIFTQSRFLDGRVFLFSTMDNNIYYLDANDMHMRCIAVPRISGKAKSTRFNNSIYKPCYDLIYTGEGIMGIYSWYDYSVYELDSRNLEFTRMEYKMSEFEWNRVMQSLQSNVLKEGGDYSNQAYRYLLHCDRDSDVYRNRRNIGKEIWSILRE